jgi:beta-glucanase (GH16 family)
MNNAPSNFKVRLANILGNFPDTTKYEEQQKALEKEFNELLEFENSEELQKYRQLKEYIESPEFEQRKKEINAQRYEDTEAYQKEKRFNELTRDKEIKNYLKVNDSDELVHYKKMQESHELKRYYDLGNFFESDEFEEFKKNLEEERNQKEKEYKETLKKHNALRKKYKWFFDFENSDELSFYNQFKDSEKLQNYKDLEEEVKNTDFSQLKKDYKRQKKEALQKLKEEIKEEKKLSKKGEDSEESHKLDELRERVNSSEFKKEWEEAENIDHKNSPEYQKYNQLQELKNDEELKRFWKIANSKTLKKYQQFKDSPEIEEFNKLNEQVNSEEFQKIPEEIEKRKFENTQEFQEYKEYQELKKSSDIKRVLKFEKSPNFKLYNETKDSEKLKEYFDLKDYVESEDFKKEKEYYKTKDKFKLSDEYQQLLEYKDLKNSENIQWYLKNIDSPKFDFFRNWDRTFYDDFSKGSLDREKWLTTYYWGKTLLQESYVQTNDKHFITDGDNISIDNGNLEIVTKQQEVEGKAWHPGFGFYPKKFQYTSGLINTGQSFRQLYGIFSAKVKVDSASKVKHSFWMVADKISPEIDVFNLNGRRSDKPELKYYWGDIKDTKNVKISRKKVSGVNLSKDYYIFTLEWNKDEIVWKINGIPVKKQKQGIPDQPMYMIFNSGLEKEIDSSELPVSMYIDWVEAYQKKSE